MAKTQSVVHYAPVFKIPANAAGMWASPEKRLEQFKEAVNAVLATSCMPFSSPLPNLVDQAVSPRSTITHGAHDASMEGMAASISTAVGELECTFQIDRRAINHGDVRIIGSLFNCDNGDCHEFETTKDSLLQMPSRETRGHLQESQAFSGMSVRQIGTYCRRAMDEVDSFMDPMRDLMAERKGDARQAFVWFPGRPLCMQTFTAEENIAELGFRDIVRTAYDSWDVKLWCAKLKEKIGHYPKLPPDWQRRLIDACRHMSINIEDTGAPGASPEQNEVYETLTSVGFSPGMAIEFLVDRATTMLTGDSTNTAIRSARQRALSGCLRAQQDGLNPLELLHSPALCRVTQSQDLTVDNGILDDDELMALKPVLSAAKLQSRAQRVGCSPGQSTRRL